MKIKQMKRKWDEKASSPAGTEEFTEEMLMKQEETMWMDLFAVNSPSSSDFELFRPEGYEDDVVGVDITLRSAQITDTEANAISASFDDVTIEQKRAVLSAFTPTDRLELPFACKDNMALANINWVNFVPDIKWNILKDLDFDEVLPEFHRLFAWGKCFCNDPSLVSISGTLDEFCLLSNLALKSTTYNCGVKYTYTPMSKRLIVSYWCGLAKPDPAQMLAIFSAYRVLCGVSFPEIRLFERIHSFCSEAYPVAFKPEGFLNVLDDLNESLLSIVGYFGDAFGNCWATIENIIKQTITTAIKTPGALFEGILHAITRGAFKQCRGLAEDAQKKLKEIVCSNCFKIAIKMCVFVWCGVDLKFLILSFLFDMPDVYTEIAPMIADLFVDDMKPEGDAQLPSVLFMTKFLSIITARVLPTAFGMSNDHINALCRDINTRATALDKSGASRAFEELSRYMLCSTENEEELTRFATQYPSTMAFVNLHTDIVNQVDKVLLPSDHINFRFYYGAHLAERKLWGRDSQRLSQITAPALQYAKEHALSPMPDARMEPRTWMFDGAAGVGKSYFCTALSNIIAGLWYNGQEQDCSFHTNRMDQYQSGYKNQAVWIIDDWGQKVDSAAAPCPDVELFFRLVNVAPLTLNMADVESKGSFGRCFLVLGSTNIDFHSNPAKNLAQLRANIQSISDVTALRRRIHNAVRVNPNLDLIQRVGKTWYVKETNRQVFPMSLEEHERYFTFSVIGADERVISAPSGRPEWSWREIVEAVVRDYAMAAHYVPPAGTAKETIEKYKLTTDYKPEGWMHDMAIGVSNFSLWRRYLPPVVRKCTCGLSGRIPAKRTCLEYMHLPGHVIIPDSDMIYTSTNDRTHHFVELDSWVMTQSWQDNEKTACLVTRDGSPLSVEEFERLDAVHMVSVKLEDDDEFVHHIKGSELSYDILLNLVKSKVSRIVVEWEGFEATYELKMCVTTVLHVEHDQKDYTHHVRKVILALLLGCAIFPSARLIYRKIKERSSDYQLVENEVVWYDAEAEVYTVDANHHPGTTIVINGQTFCKKYSAKAGGYKWYPEGPTPENTNKFLRVIDSRVASQMPRLQNSIFAIVANGRLVGNAFAVSQSVFMTAGHVAHNILKSYDKVDFIRDEQVFEMIVRQGTGATVRDCLVITDVGTDIAMMEFTLSRSPAIIPKCSDHFNKLNYEAPASGQARFLCRNADGKLNCQDCEFVSSSKSSGYASYTLAAKDHRMTRLETTVGHCGGIYLNTGSNHTEVILGIHVAGRDVDNNKVMHLFNRSITQFKQRLIGSTNYQCEGPSGAANELHEAGLFKTMPLPSYTISRVGHQKKQSRFYSDIRPNYKLSRMFPYRKDGVVIDPLNVAACKLGAVCKNSQWREHSLHDFATELGTALRPFVEQLDLPSDLDFYVGANYLPSSNRSSSSSYPFGRIGPTKRIFFTDDVDVKLNGDAKFAIEQVESRLLPHDWDTRPFEEFEEVIDVSSALLKGEPVTLEKYDEGRTRLFTSVPFHIFVLQRKYFYGLAYNMCTSHLRFNSLLGLAPADFGDIHRYLGSKCDRPKILTADFKYMDGHVTPTDVDYVFRIVRAMFPNTGGVYRELADVGLVDKNNFMRYHLLKRLSEFVIGYKDTAAQPGQMHPSGSFLTCIINHLVQQVLWPYAISLQVEDTPLEVYENCPSAFLGDDSAIAIHSKYQVDCERLKRDVKTLGFIITDGDKKTDKLTLHDYWNGQGSSTYVLLSRRFCRVGNAIIGVLEPDRADKIMAFTSIKHEIEVMPQQLLSFLEETAPYTLSSYAPHKELIAKYVAIFDKHLQPGFLMWAYDRQEAGDLMNIQFEFLRLYNSSERFEPEGETSSDDPQHRTSDRTEALGGNSADAPATFIEDVVEGTEVARDGLIEAWKLRGMESGQHGEAKVWQRPHVVHEFTLDALTPSDPFEMFMPSQYFNDNFNAQAKLANNGAMIGTACARVIISSTPMASCKLFLGARPLGVPVTTDTQATGDPGVEIDISSGKTAEIKVPCVVPQGYVFANRYIPGLATANVLFDWCRIYVRRLTPVRVASPTAITVKILAWLEDVRLQAPTISNFALSPQGFLPSENGARRILHNATKFVKTIGGVITDSAVLVKNVATVAAMAGLSDPNQLNNTTFVMDLANVDAPHMLGTAPAISMAMTQAQRVILPVGAFGCHDDEMSIERYCSRMALVRTYEWSASVVSETTIATIRVGPGLYTDVGGLKSYSPLSAVASMFRFWQGTIRYRLAIAKTRFHGGILEVAWRMGLSDVPITDDAQAAICYRAVWDIQESTSLEFECPFVCHPMWAAIVLEAVDVQDIRLTMPTGFLQIRVLNPLVSAGGLVVDTVDLLLYCGGGKDIKFAVPCLPSENQITPPVAGKGKEEVERFRPEGVFQEDETLGVENTGSALMLASATPCSQFDSVACLGEDITNLRMLARRFARSDQVTTTQNFSHSEMMTKQPFVARMANMFAFVTGGFRVVVHQSAGGENRLIDARLEMFNSHLLGLPVYHLQKDKTAVFNVPYHMLVPYVPVAKMQSLVNPMPLTLRVNMFGGGAGAIMSYAYAAADDFTFGWQIGPTPLDYADDVTPLWNEQFTYLIYE